MVDSEGPLEVLSRKFAPWLSQAGYDVSLLDDFARMRLYRETIERTTPVARLLSLRSDSAWAVCS
jgi:hypothetical protein